jgi:hypothetical protein
MSPKANDESPSGGARNWPEVREWAGLAIALSALLFGIVSFWTTAQISGLEDYLRSEITRRNVELDTASLQAQKMNIQVQVGEDRLEELRLTADRLSASTSESQLQLVNSHARSLELLAEQQRSQAELNNSRQRLEVIDQEVASQMQLLNDYRREEVLAQASSLFFRMSYNRLEGSRRVTSGTEALDEIRNFGITSTDPTKQQYYERVRTVGTWLCRKLDGYSPEIAAELDYPPLGPRPGVRREDGTVWMTRSENSQWIEQVTVWSRERDIVIAYNSSIREARSSVMNYIRDALSHCSCVALSAESNSCTPMPSEPDLAMVILPRP